jgi:hypothetical protein
MKIRKIPTSFIRACDECNKQNKTIYCITIQTISIRLCHQCLCVLSDKLEQIATGLKHD